MKLILINATVYTMEDDQPIARSVVIEDGLITHVGNGPTWEGQARPDSAVYDLGGKPVIPGFIDSHTHPGMVARSSWHITLPRTTDIDEILAFVRKYAHSHPVQEQPFLYFEYYPSLTFRDSPPTKELLDTAVSDRPCLCQDSSDHEHWVNSRMLELMEITKDTPDPIPGIATFVRDAEGQPTGLIREMAYEPFIGTMYEKIGWAPPRLDIERMQVFLRFLTTHGVTTVFDALTDDEVLGLVAELDRRGDLNLCYEAAYRFERLNDLPDVIGQLRAAQARYGSEHIQIKTVKLFLDGTNESGNSALLDPKCGDFPRTDHGEIAMETGELADCLMLCNAEDVDVHIHLVGDRAFRVACDAAEMAQAMATSKGLTWSTQITLAHCELVDEADMLRPAKLGLVVNWTPHWSGGYFGEAAKTHLGDGRWNRMYRFNEIAESGTVVSFSSDVVTAYESHRANPLFGIQVGHTRADPDVPLDPQLYPDSIRPTDDARLPREILLRGYTINGARQLGLADRLGSVRPGKAANLVVLGEDPLLVDADRLGGIKCDAVLFEGRVVAGHL